MNNNTSSKKSEKDTSTTEISVSSNCSKEKYIEQLSDNERKTYEIANQHLESSFSVEKSIGFINWKNK